MAQPVLRIFPPPAPIFCEFSEGRARVTGNLSLAPALDQYASSDKPVVLAKGRAVALNCSVQHFPRSVFLMLVIGNDVVSQLLTMRDCIRVQEAAFRKLPTGESIHRPRIDMYVPCERADGYFRWGTMEGANDGYFA